MKSKKPVNSLDKLVQIYKRTYPDSRIELRKDGRDAFLKLDLGEGIQEWKFQHPGPFKAYTWLLDAEMGKEELYVDAVFNNPVVKVWIPLKSAPDLNADFFEKHATKAGEFSLLAWWLNLSGSLLLYTTYETAGVVGLGKEGASDRIPSIDA